MTIAGEPFEAVSPFEEMVAFEALMGRVDATFSKLSKQVGRSVDLLPSKLARLDSESEARRPEVEKFLRSKKGFTVCHRCSFHYPAKLNDTDVPVHVFYAKGDLGLLESQSVSVVGTRNVTSEGAMRTAKIVRGLCEEGYSVVSGLAKGVDTVALSTAIQHGGRVIGVIGTPIDEYYPKENKVLQDEIAERHLLISQVPFFRYNREPFKFKRFYFPLRNETMAAISQATIIVEASDTSGTLIQAKACIAHGRKLFILESCFQNPKISWPQRFLKLGAIRVSDVSHVIAALHPVGD